ncbi:LLM class F420-dependent oxidoreductase [Nocardioides daejeonensis]|uniref:LLM class F420-dependent oxidoreductase n=1 Tax=Nocardioides daejeonensis TaxID=1046556 RepID=UPI000D740821|nr:LLM class F420-dependent oxidoreductase [Nocardioides daejeonensis]
MRLGLNSPLVTAFPGQFSPWEPTAGITEFTAIAEAADRLGYDHLTCSEHVAVPAEIAQQRGGTYWDPLVTLSWVAARTERIRLATQILVIGYHHPLEIAKRYGTLDMVSGGRVILGLGVGSLEQEFNLLGAEFAKRGKVADDALDALRGSLGKREVSHHGPFFDYDDLVVEPHAVQERLPLWLGGHTPVSLRRALKYGDGWVPFGLAHDKLREMLDGVEVPDGFELVLGAGRPLDPGADPEQARAALARTRDAGATIANVHLQAASAAHYVEQLEALAAIAKEI